MPPPCLEKIQKKGFHHSKLYDLSLTAPLPICLIYTDQCAMFNVYCLMENVQWSMYIFLCSLFCGTYKLLANYGAHQMNENFIIEHFSEISLQFKHVPFSAALNIKRKQLYRIKVDCIFTTAVLPVRILYYLLQIIIC